MTSSLVTLVLALSYLARRDLFSPWWLVRLVLVPLGLVRLAHAFGSLCMPGDARGGALLAGAWALLHLSPGRRRQRAQAWIQSKLDATPGALQRSRQIMAAGVVAHGLTAAARGDRDGARRLLQALSSMDPQVRPLRAYGVAQDWLIADAAERGDYSAVRVLGEGPDATPLAQFLARHAASRGWCASTAERHVGPAAQSWLLWLWLRSGRPLTLWSRLWEMLRMAQGPDARPTDSPSAAALPWPEPSPVGALATALRGHAYLLTLPQRLRTPEALTRLGADWDAALADGATRRYVIERSLLLGVTRGEDLLRQLREDVAGELAECLWGLPLPQPPTGSVLWLAVRRVRDDLLRTLELRCGALRDRVNAKRALAIGDEWREWAELRAHYEESARLGGREVQRLLWSRFQQDLCSYAVWLYNLRKERPLANAIFRYLLTEAGALGDTETVALQKKNVACGPR